MSDNNIRILSEPISYQELKEMGFSIKITGIYKIENLINHKVYIGQSVDIIDRLNGHLSKRKIDGEYRFTEKNTHLRNSLEKYGAENFSFEVLKETQDLNYWEIFLIQIYRSYDRNFGYNISEGGTGGYLGEEWAKCVSEGVKRHYNSPEGEKTKELLRKNRLNQVFPDDMQERRKKSLDEYWNSPEGLAKKKELSEKGKMQKHTEGLHWYNNGVKNTQAKECPEGFVPGRLGDFTCSEESKKKKSEWYKNLTDEERKIYKEHLSESHKGKTCSEERKRHISEAKKGVPGRPQSDDIKDKISAGMKGKKRFTNGIIEVRAYECPEGFVPGTLKGYLKKNSNINSKE